MARYALNVLMVALACALAAVVAYRHGHSVGAAKVAAQWGAERAVLNQKIAEETQRAIETERKLRAQLDANRRSYEREKARIAANYNAALDRLRDRPERPSTPAVPDAAGVATPARGCTGAELYREDAVVALGIGRDADLVVAALRECRAGYQAAKDRLDALNRTAN